MKNLTGCIIFLLVLSITLPAHSAEREKKTSVAGVAIGVGCIAGGSIFSIYNYSRARAQHEVYRKSAFTENTNGLHSEIRRRDLFTVLGAALAGMGLIGVVVSF